MKQGIVYWKHLDYMTDVNKEGYVGISNDFERRMKEHNRDAFAYNSLLRVHDKMREHKDEVQTTIIYEGNYNDCLDYEEKLRPRWHIGWNMAIGGGRPGSGWKPNRLWLDNRLWHPKYGEEVINVNFTPSDLNRKYIKSKTIGGNIANILRGKLCYFHDWELADKQLAMRVQDKLSAPWDQVYLQKDNEVISVHKSGLADMKKHYGFKKGFGIKNIVIGATNSLYGWELATEEEWLNTTERLKFK